MPVLTDFRAADFVSDTVNFEEEIVFDLHLLFKIEERTAERDVAENRAILFPGLEVMTDHDQSTWEIDGVMLIAIFRVVSKRLCHSSSQEHIALRISVAPKTKLPFSAERAVKATDKIVSMGDGLFGFRTALTKRARQNMCQPGFGSLPSAFLTIW